MKKLKSKHTGVMGELLITDKHYAVTYGGTSHTATALYTSLDNLNEDWEDYDETETYFVNAVGGVDINALTDKRARENFYNKLKAIGNYFDTREEAEQAVEKVKAYKRLKDKGFRFFNNKIIGEYGNVSYRLTHPATTIEEKDLDLLFGGEE